MLRKGIVIAVLCLFPAMAFADTGRGMMELTLGGSGNNGPNFNGFSAAVDGSFGVFIADVVEISLRQSGQYTDLGGARGWDASTRLALDLHVPISDVVVPYAGANLGYVYGNTVRDTWEAAPEAGVKFFVNGSTFIYVSAEYQFFFNQNSTAHSALSNGQFIYGLGVGFRF